MSDQQQPEIPLIQNEGKSEQEKASRFLDQSPEFFERGFAALAAVCTLGIPAARMWDYQPAANDLLLLAASNVSFALASYISRSRRAKNGLHSRVPWPIVVMAAVIFSGTFTHGLILSVPAQQDPHFHIIPEATLKVADFDKPFSDEVMSPYGAVTEDSNGFSLIPLNIVLKLSIANLQAFQSRVVHLSMEQSKGEYGPWSRLCRVSLLNSALILSMHPNAENNLVRPIGNLVESLSQKSIAPHDAESVWTAWTCTKGRVCQGSWVRIEIADNQGATNTFLINLDGPGGYVENLGTSTFAYERKAFITKTQIVNSYCP